MYGFFWLSPNHWHIIMCRKKVKKNIPKYDESVVKYSPINFSTKLTKYFRNFSYKFTKWHIMFLTNIFFTFDKKFNRSLFRDNFVKSEDPFHKEWNYKIYYFWQLTSLLLNEKCKHPLMPKCKNIINTRTAINWTQEEDLNH